LLAINLVIIAIMLRNKRGIIEMICMPAETDSTQTCIRLCA